MPRAIRASSSALGLMSFHFHRTQPPPVLENQRPFPIHAVKVAKFDPVVGEILEPLVFIRRRHTFL